MQPIAVRRAGPDDAPAIARLHVEAFPDAWSATEIESLMSLPGAAFVASLPGTAEVVGFVIGRTAADEAEILSVASALALRRKGIARRLVDAFSEWAAGEGAATLFLEVAAGNAAALALYEASGFVPAGIRRGYYRVAGRPPEDAHLLSCLLPHSGRVD